MTAAVEMAPVESAPEVLALVLGRHLPVLQSLGAAALGTLVAGHGHSPIEGGIHDTSSKT